MITVLAYVLVFLAGGLLNELARICQERYRLRQVVRFAIHWCDRPGCPRCWGRWGR
ncbi:MAG TPA: hypothetical protein VM347_08180 [Nonomuraea sp.]|nr:hypothetical protein [Nonomuraea sp.]